MRLPWFPYAIQLSIIAIYSSSWIANFDHYCFDHTWDGLLTVSWLHAALIPHILVCFCHLFINLLSSFGYFMGFGIYSSAEFGSSSSQRWSFSIPIIYFIVLAVELLCILSTERTLMMMMNISIKKKEEKQKSAHVDFERFICLSCSGRTLQGMMCKIIIATKTESMK